MAHPRRGTGCHLRAVHGKVTRTNLGVISARTDQCFGWWAGRFADDEVDVSFEGIAGWAEDVHNRW